MCIEQRPFLIEKMPTAIVANKGINTEKQAGPLLIKNGCTDFKQGPLISTKHLMREPFADGSKLRFYLLCRACTQIRHGDGIEGSLWQDALLAIGQHHRTQHLMPFDQPIPCLLQPLYIQLVTFVLKIEVCGN